MKVFDANITPPVADMLNEMLISVERFTEANDRLFQTFGIHCFFMDQGEYELFREVISLSVNVVLEPDRSEYGDFQTNLELAKSVSRFLKNRKLANPGLIVEPTCGKGNFIVAALSAFDQIKKIIGVEIYKPYTWETKFNIIDFYISNPDRPKPEIEIFHFNVFDFDFAAHIIRPGDEILILGNPPWVTNAKLSSLESGNLPPKSNFKKHNGFDAITGKGNFDIGEYITLMMFDAFQNTKGNFAFLVKNSVIRNIVFDQYKRKYKISGIEKLTIDSKKEFNVSVDSALLYCKLDSASSPTCREYDFYANETMVREFGWVSDKFVSNTELYRYSYNFDGLCPFEWRQGIKHDLSSVMELERKDGYYQNGMNERITIEEDLVYGLLKSSDLKQAVVNQPRKFTIVTQRKVGQDTSFIRHKFPKTFQYLSSHKQLFDRRKSSIYNNKPDFSIFGIGGYAFTAYKVAISGLYKTYSFSLVLPLESKPLMLDDTCYFIGFDNLAYAVYATLLLNSKMTRELLQSITFSDAKRTFTKDVLMRIDLYTLATNFSLTDLQNELNAFNIEYNLKVSFDHWDSFVLTMKPGGMTKQMNIFSGMEEEARFTS